jgi:hypothetical protein
MMISRKEKFYNGSLGEELSSIAFDCINSPSHGYDIITVDGVKGEVRTRTAGTDGDYPRLTVNPKKMAISDFVVVIHFAEDLTVIRAVLIETEDLKDLYDQYLQSKREQAHIPWKKIIAHPKALDVRDLIISADH